MSDSNSIIHYWKTSFAHFTGAESSSLGGWPENEIKTALRISFPLLDVDIDRKKLGAEMGLHEHFLGEAHAMLFIKTTRIMRRLWRGGGIRRSCSNVWFIDGYYLRGFRISMLSPASTSHQEVTRALFSWWDRDSILSPIAHFLYHLVGTQGGWKTWPFSAEEQNSNLSQKEKLVQREFMDERMGGIRGRCRSR